MTFQQTINIPTKPATLISELKNKILMIATNNMNFL